MDHEYKVWPEFFQAVLDGTKTFEWRKDDRTPRPEVGDFFVGREWEPVAAAYTGRVYRRTITHVFRDGFGLPYGYCVLSLAASPCKECAKKDEAMNRAIVYTNVEDQPGKRLTLIRETLKAALSALPSDRKE